MSGTYIHIHIDKFHKFNIGQMTNGYETYQDNHIYSIR